MQRGVRSTAPGAALIEEHDAIGAGVEEASLIGLGAAARSAVNKDHRLALRIARDLVIDLVDRRDAQVTAGVGLARRIERATRRRAGIASGITINRGAWGMARHHQGPWLAEQDDRMRPWVIATRARSCYRIQRDAGQRGRPGWIGSTAAQSGESLPAASGRPLSPAEARVRIEAVLGDIVGCQVDAIVNAANNSLLGGSGVDGAIHHAAGPGLLAECRTLGGCSTGDAKLTRGYNFASPLRHPRCRAGVVRRQPQRTELLARCYRRCLEIAVAHGITTLAFSAISTGVYGYPLVPATRIAVREVYAALRRGDPIRWVTFVCFDRTTLQTYQNLWRRSRAASLPSPCPSRARPPTSTSGSLRVPTSAVPASRPAHRARIARPAVKSSAGLTAV